MSIDSVYVFISIPFAEDGSGGSTPHTQLKSFVQQRCPIAADISHSLFEIPKLKIGTLDTLMEASDELCRVDAQLESIVAKMLNILEDVSGKSRSDIAKVRSDISCDQYLTSFRWDDRRYDLRDSLKVLIDRISLEVQSTDDKLRLKYIEYNDTKKKLSQAQRKEQGNLTIKPLGDIVREFNKSKHGDEAPLDSEFLTTLYLVLPTSSLVEWNATYWHLGNIEFIVPNSSEVILQDKDYSLVNVVLFKRIVEDFKKECRTRKWMIRENINNDVVFESEGLRSSTEDLRTQLLRMLATSFGEAYQGYVHIKAIRVFVESVLKYGLPPQFVSICFRMTEKQERSLRSKLRSLYEVKDQHDKFDEPADNGALQLEFPYVSLKMLNIHRSK